MTAATGHDPQLLRLARRLVWWQEPQAALHDERRFLAQAMTDGSWEDMQTIRTIYGDDALRAVLRNAPPGVFDIRSWSYWHLVLGDGRTPPLPRRRL
jgi:hypothetical protein